MDFEYDSAKSHSNKKKHGIDFVEAQKLWEDENRLEILARTEDEPRSVLIAEYEEKVWAAIFAYRGNRIRLISVRRARPER